MSKPVKKTIFKKSTCHLIGDLKGTPLKELRLREREDDWNKTMKGLEFVRVQK